MMLTLCFRAKQTGAPVQTGPLLEDPRTADRDANGSCAEGRPQLSLMTTAMSRSGVRAFSPRRSASALAPAHCGKQKHAPVRCSQASHSTGPRERLP